MHQPYPLLCLGLIHLLLATQGCTHTTSTPPTTPPQQTAPDKPTPDKPTPDKPVSSKPAPSFVDLEHIKAALTLDVSDPSTPRLSGDVTLSANAQAATVMTLNAVGFESHQITSSPPARWDYDGQRFQARWDTPVDGPVSIHVTYTVQPSKGLGTGPEALWTTFHTWHWLPVRDDPSERATLDLHIDAPKGWTTIATGDGPDKPGPDIASRLPHPSYTYGFFAGRLDAPPAHQGQLHVWGADSQDKAQRVLQRTQAAVDRWKTHLKHDPGDYVQVFVPGRAAQELAGMAFISAGYLDRLLKTPDEDWLLVHEMAHQGWGNRVTCATWGDFWLNEAIVAWWVGRDKAIRGQVDAYEQELALWTKRTARILDKGGERRIARPGHGVEGAGGPLAYNAGATLIDDLSRAVGVEIFEGVLADLLQRSADTGLSLTTEHFLTSLPLNEDACEIARCRLKDAGATCAPLPNSPPAPTGQP